MHARTPDVSRARYVSQQWEDGYSDCSRGLVRLWLRHGTLLGACRDLRTSGVAVPFVLERLSSTATASWGQREACAPGLRGSGCRLGGYGQGLARVCAQGDTARCFERATSVPWQESKRSLR